MAPMLLGKKILALMAYLVLVASADPIPDNCIEMFQHMQEHIEDFQPGRGQENYIPGCREICDKVKELRSYSGAGSEGAKYACDQGRRYGCFWAGSPPTTLADIGC
mmetsp:Transcript_42552/g.91368  ORF Transcript_42552/g.91368 Transcript_42552/m.91368 type:complete len:106 (+) Transcript_42552:160-477(+)